MGRHQWCTHGESVRDLVDHNLTHYVCENCGEEDCCPLVRHLCRNPLIREAVGHLAHRNASNNRRWPITFNGLTSPYTLPVAGYCIESDVRKVRFGSQIEIVARSANRFLVTVEESPFALAGSWVRTACPQVEFDELTSEWRCSEILSLSSDYVRLVLANHAVGPISVHLDAYTVEPEAALIGGALGAAVNERPLAAANFYGLDAAASVMRPIQVDGEGKVLTSPGSPVTVPVDAKCPICHALILDGGALVFCGSCRLAHHEECWNSNNHKCAAYGCAGIKKQIPTPTPPTEFHR